MMTSNNHIKDEITSKPVPVEEVRRYATDCLVAVGKVPLNYNVSLHP